MKPNLAPSHIFARRCLAAIVFSSLLLSAPLELTAESKGTGGSESPNTGEPESSATDETESLFIHPLILDLYVNSGKFDAGVLEGAREVEVGRSQAERQPFIWAERPSMKFREGYIGYREAARWTDPVTGSERAVLEIANNTGGTGVFGSLGLFEKMDDDLFLVHWFIGAGDRCNDGFPRLVKLLDHEVVYAVSATPFRLLNPLDHNNWRMISLRSLLGTGSEESDDTPGTLFGWRPYEDVANSAISCAGEIVYRRCMRTRTEEVVGVVVDRERFLEDTQGRLQSCVNDWLRELPLDLETAEKSWVPLEKWLASFEALAERCVSGNFPGGPDKQEPPSHDH